MQDVINRPPFILVILIDALRADHVGLFGSKLGLTPFMDSLGKSAAVFESATAPATWTRASVASLFTSCFPGSIQVQDRNDALPADLLTLAEVLNTYGGYRCIAISSNGNAGPMMAFDQGFDTFEIPKEKRGYPKEKGLVPAEIVNKYALKYISKWIRRGKKYPLFIFLHYVEPHAPYMKHPGLLKKPEPKGRFDGSRGDLSKMNQTPIEELTDEDMARIKYLYAGEVRYVDNRIGELFARIMKYDPELLDKTLIVITADHGEGLWNHGWRPHGHLPYEDQIHIPLLIRLPGMGQGDGMRISQPVSLIDVAPTLISVCRIPKPRQFQGFDLSPLIAGERRGEEMDYIYSEVKLEDLDYESIRFGDFKVIRNRSGHAHDHKAYQMYDLSSDPTEQENLVKGGKMPDWGARLINALQAWSEAVKEGAVASSPIDYDKLDQETLDQLRTLGYVDIGK